MIEIIEERKEPDLNTEDKKVSEEINEEADAQKEAVESEVKAADDNEVKTSSSEEAAAADEEKSSDSEAAETEDKTETTESTAEPEKSESCEADGKADACEAAGEPEATENKDTAHETENGDKEPDMLFGSRKLKKEIEKKDELIKEQNEKYIRLMAEFERGFSLVAEEDAEDPFTEGMQKIYKQLMTTLTDLGVTPIEAVGKEFDPNLHNAVMHVDDESVGENIVVQEFQKGYMYKDSVVRHSMVQVAN